MSSIKEFYRGETVFITGATGFIGKALVEKVLRTCSGVKTVYLLMRPKKGQTPQDRIKAYVENMFFERLKSEQPDATKKLKVVEGDSKKLRLGLSDSDFEKVKSCSMIFHLAASVRFDDHLKDAILLNTRGAREVCEIAKTMPNLKSLVHVSTAYVQPLNLNVIEELIDIDCDWRDYIKMAENLPTEVLDAMTAKLTKFAPNTYTYTKLLAEHICNDYRNDFQLPIVIYRPSVVSTSDFEPFTGWSESMSGYNGQLSCASAGLKRVHVGHGVMEHIPVDICVKGMIVASERHKKGSKFSDVIPVYNAAATRTYTVHDAEALTPHLQDHLIDQAVGLPYMVYVSNDFIGSILRLFLEILPALIIDGLLILLERKPKVMKLQRILAYAESSLKYFIKNKLSFDNRKFNDLGTTLHDDDKEDFYLLARLPMTEYLIKSYIVTKEVILNENAESAARAKKKAPYFKALGWMIKLLLMFVVYKILFCCYGVVKNNFF